MHPHTIITSTRLNSIYVAIYVYINIYICSSHVTIHAHAAACEYVAGFEYFQIRCDILCTNNSSNKIYNVLRPKFHSPKLKPWTTLPHRFIRLVDI